jgi:hypothetical protein
MELQESGDGLRWGDWTSWSDGGFWVQIAKTASRAVGRTEPDVHLIKQVEQVTTSALVGPTWRFAAIPDINAPGPGAVLGDASEEGGDGL